VDFRWTAICEGTFKTFKKALIGWCLWSG
jgi:hypothetical protein